MYLGSDLSKMTNVNGKECWVISFEKYTALRTNVESVLEKCGLSFLPKCVTSISFIYCPDINVTEDLKEDGIQWYQELIETLTWAVEICRIDILLEVSMLSTHL